MRLAALLAVLLLTAGNAFACPMHMADHDRTVAQDSSNGKKLPPPQTGDQGVVSPPKAGPQSTPVIPPPGTPGGNQEVQPK